MARNTGKGWRIGQVLDRYQQGNQITGLYDVYNAFGDYLRRRSRQVLGRGSRCGMQ